MTVVFSPLCCGLSSDSRDYSALGDCTHSTLYMSNRTGFLANRLDRRTGAAGDLTGV